MKHLQKNVIYILLCFLILLHASACFCEDYYRQFSLGGGHLTTVPPDTKEPEPVFVTARYGFEIAKDFLPYMGTGLAFAYQPDAQSGDITRLRTGVAAQVGFSYLLGDNLTLKMDYKYLAVSPEQQRGDSKTTPQSLGIGINIKF
jgi:outer membrane protein W